PAIAVSIGNVTCRSISSGGRPSTIVLTWTCTLVMSGTASMGRRRRLNRPTLATAAVTATTAQRWTTEKWSTRSSRVRASGRLVSVFIGACLLLELGLQPERVSSDDARAALEPRDEFRGGS